MTTATLKFKLGYGEDSDDLHFKQVTHAVDSLAALWDVQQMLREIYKYDDTLDEKQSELVDKIRTKFFEILADNHVDLDELYS